MLSEKQILEIREHLERAQNPVFLYDNDVDGLCSYVLLRRFLGRGKGVAVRSHPKVDPGYAKKSQELNADYIFVLDRPHLGHDFVEEIKKLQLPVVWIDHHDVENESYEYDNLFVYSPLNSKDKSDEPVTYWAYRIANMNEDIWIAIMGCISDHHLPDFADEFSENYGEYWGRGIKEPFDAYYNTEVGLLARALSFGLKDSITHVVQLQNFMIKCRNLSEMLLELESNRPFGRKYRDIRQKYDLLIKKAKLVAGKNVLFFRYGGDMSISSDVSNELSYLYPKHIVVVAYTAGPICNMSLRGDNVKGLIEKILPEFEHATGGGHRDAVGARLQTDDLERFKKLLLEKVENERAKD